MTQHTHLTDMSELKNLLAPRIAAGEDSSTEFKRQLDNPEATAAELCALLNFEGGLLLVGVDDDGQVPGLSAEDSRKTVRLLDEVMQDHIRPAVSLQVQTVLWTPDQRLVLVHVPRSEQTHATKQGRYYVRSGSAKREMREQELRRKVLAHAPVCADEIAVEPLDDAKLAQASLQAYVAQRGFPLPTATAAQRLNTLQRLNLAHSSGDINVAGAVLFYEHFFRAGFEVKAVAYVGTQLHEPDFVDKAQFHGHLERLYNDTMNFLRRNLPRRSGQGFNSQKLAVAEEALQEALVNALVHRDYGLASPVRVLLFKDRLEICSPGALTNHLDVEKIKHGVPVARNPTLAGHAHHLLPYSGIGTGVKRILDFHPRTELLDERDLQQFRVVFGLNADG